MSEHGRFAALLGAVSIALLVQAAGAAAQPLDEETRQRAREAWAQAMTDYDAERYDEALAGFRTVYELTRKPEALLNIGQCYYYLMEPASAMTYLTRARAALGSDIDPAVGSDIDDKISRLRDKVSSLVIDVNVDGVAIEVDGESVGRSPILDPMYVLPGTVRVRATARDGTIREVSGLAERGGDTTITVDMPEAVEPPIVEPPPPVVIPTGPGRLLVECDVEDALVTVDGGGGMGPPWEDELDPGTYLVEVTAEGYEPYAEEVTVAPEQVTTVRVSLMSTEPGGLDPIWFWSGVGATAVLAAGTITAGVIASGLNSDADGYLDQARGLRDNASTNCGAEPDANPACWNPYIERINVLRGKYDDVAGNADSAEIATWVLLGLTAAAVGGTIYLLIESAPLFGGSEADISIAPMPLPEGMGLTAIGRF